MRFSQDFIERVRETTNIVDIIGQHTQLRRSGTHRLVGLCPFHGEKTPSFSVSEDKQMYFCFGCKATGNVYHFVQAQQGLSFPEAVEFLAQRAGIEIPREAVASAADAREQDQRKERSKMLFRINQFVSSFFHSQFKSAGPESPVQTYLRNRGILAETIDRFQLGYAAADWEYLARALARKNVPLDLAGALGLIRARTEGKSGHYDIFRDRLMFPIISPTNQVLGFGGRVLTDAQPKYLNSPESEVFHKGRVFYGLNEAAKFIRLEDRVVIVEGYMDFLALYQAGIQSVVATLGTALTPEHARLLKRHTKNVVVLFDGDEAGQDAAERSLPILLNEGLIPRGLTLPDELDPDEYVMTKGAAALNELLGRAPELFVLVLERQLLGYRGGSAEKVNLVDRLVPHLQACADRRLRDLYIREIADRLAVDLAWVADAVRSKVGHEPRPSAGVSHSPEAPKGEGSGDTPKPEDLAPLVKINLGQAPKAELYLLNTAVMKDKYFQQVMGSGVVELLSHEGVRQAFARLVQLYGQMPNKFDSLTPLLVSQVEPADAIGLHLQPPLVDMSEEGAEKLLADCGRKIRQAFLRSQSRQLRANMRGQEPAEQLEKLEQIMNIHRSRHSLNKES